MGKGGGGPTQTTSTSNTSNIPEYAQPYVETMLGATQKQLYKMDDSGGITGFQPYKAFGGTYDDQGKMTGYDAGKALAGFSPAQQQAQQGIMGLQVPGQYGAATNLTGQAALGSLGAADQAGNLQNQALGYGSAGAQYGDVGQMYGAQGAQQAAQAARQTANQARMYGAQGSQAGQQAAGLSNLYGGISSQAGQQYAGLSGATGAQGAGIGQSLGQMSTDPNAVQSYMNPYIQASLNPQLAEIQRQYDITGTQQQSGATKSGAFGGSREALMAAENQRNAGLAKNQLIGQGYNTAFQQAQQQMNAANQAALAGNQQALSGYGQAGQQALAGYGMGLQGAGQAGSQAMQGAQAGLQGVGAQQAAGQLGLAGTAQGMQGAGYGLQGAQAGMQGVQGALGAGQYGLAGLGQAGQMAGQLAGIGGQQLAAQQGIYNAQNAVGGQQQQLEQQKINQAIQDYANAQQYPIMQLGTMSNMLRGLPMQAQTTQQYQAQANPITQGIGALGAGASLYNATKGAKGGIMSYDVGGSIRAKLEDMPDESLKAQLKSSSSESIKNDIKQILATRSMAGVKQAASGGVMRFDEGKLVLPATRPIGRDEKEENNKGILPGGIAATFGNKVPISNNEAGLRALGDAVVSPIKSLGDYFSNRMPWGEGTKQREKALQTNISQEAADSESARMRGRGQAPVGSTQEAIDNINAGNVPPKRDFNTGIIQAGPAGAAPAGTNPAGAPPSVASSDGTGKVSKEKIDQIRKTNPEFNAAMGNKPGPTPSVTQDIMDLISKNLGISPKPPVDENAGMSTAQILARDEKIAKEFAGENPAMARRAQIMAEKTSAADEAKYTQAMRMAEFFAMWGSTPGNTIVAGLNAMKAKIPDFITDKKEATKIRREMDKSIADLDQIDYLEKIGKIDAADKKRTASIKFGIDTWGTQIAKAASLTATTVKEITDKEIAASRSVSEANVAHIKGGYDLQKENISRSGQRENTEIAKANEDYRKTQSDINNSRLKTEYVNLAKQADREIKNDTPAEIKTKIMGAKDRLADMERGFEQNEKRARDRLNSTYRKYGYPTDGEKSSSSNNVNTGKLPSLDSDKYKLK